MNFYLYYLLVAMWCGNPNYNYQVSDKINACREHLMDCLAKSNLAADRDACLKNEKLK